MAVRLAPDVSATPFLWVWRLVLGCGLALAMVLGSEYLPAAPAASPSAAPVPAASPTRPAAEIQHGACEVSLIGIAVPIV